MCLPAYVYAAELSRDGDANIYAQEHYPLLQREGTPPGSAPSSTVAHLTPYISDAYEYPPPFLLLPRLVLAITNDFLLIRTLFFVLQGLALGAVLVGAAIWIGGRDGSSCGLLSVAVWASLPVMFTLQWGQVHALVVSAAIAGMLAFEERRPAVGGALLAVATVTKLFPAVLIIRLIARRQYRGAFWTIGWCAALMVLGIVVLGIQPYRAFIEYQLPRLQSGEAFAFAISDPLAIAVNESIYAIPSKVSSLAAFPCTNCSLAGSRMAMVYGVALVAVAVFAAEAGGRRERVASWVALLVLGSLVSPFAPNLYVTFPLLWLLILVVPRVRHSAWRIGALAILWILAGMLPPLQSIKATTAAWLVGQLGMLGISVWVALQIPARSATE
jgi:hypothetical protein